ncbi:EAL domain-containing protein [Pseudomonas putida]|uniref:EAL domain-containing protein n=1 Tax=Pseudomonas putida TaxID=303 RepID=UPI0018AAE42E|nr:EAL domain-containing protein [Pseudomonas putida]MBF8670253.1 EAL domain-containing protein [Pseudomonas putida]MBF8713127.1 EAL domain-containing protein [Pseudomonas putida]
MFVVPTVDCIVLKHDLSLVFVAVAICAIGSFFAIKLLQHAYRSTGLMRWVWVCVSGVITGLGIWTTHFVAMLAYMPGIQSGRSIGLTIMSLVVAIGLTIASFAVALTPGLKGARWLGGALTGCGVAVMHHTGMAAYEMTGHVMWNLPWIVLTISLGALFGSMALSVGLYRRTYGCIAMGALLLTLSISALHFTAMTGTTPGFEKAEAVSTYLIPSSWLVVLITIAYFIILLLTFTGIAIDICERRKAKRELDRLNSLGYAAFEGLLVCEDNIISIVNASLATLIGCDPEHLEDSDISHILPDPMALHWLKEKPNSPLETLLQPYGNAEPIIVEVNARPVVYAQRLQMVVAVRDLRDRKKAEQHIYYLAHHDSLTGLANRNAFDHALENNLQAHRPGNRCSGKYMALLYLDLDRFKEVNDLFGHAAGDKLLQAVARSAQQVLRQGQVMARLGGDEFAIIAPGLSDPQQAARIAEAVLKAFQDENQRSPVSSTLISTSIGIAIFPSDANDCTSLMRSADVALYRAKADGRGVYRFFADIAGERIYDRKRIESELRSALVKQEFSLLYQPLVLACNREIIGFEVSLCWYNREGSFTPSNSIIPTAEVCGLTLEITEWVITAACVEATRWEGPLSIVVNISASQLANPMFVKTIQNVLARTGLIPKRLEFGITEVGILRDPVRTLEALSQLKGLGVQLALDDFGLEQSSFSSIRYFPFDKIKINGDLTRAVVFDKQAAAIVRAIVGLGNSLELTVLAKGVDTEEVMNFLIAESCEQAQGNLFGGPEAVLPKYISRAVI